MARAVVALLAVALMPLAACGKDSPAVDDATRATTAPAPSTTTTVAKGRFGSPLEAANHLMTAWKVGDQTAALQAGSSAAVDALFVHEYSQYQSRGCDAPSQLGSDCNYRLAQAGGVRIHVTSDPAAGFFVESVTFID